ncbi:hypothetical protein ACQCP0_07960 [Ralstonia pseudosolanacearum]|uniref:Transmembrane protein n=1 Tax=Ralstonia solanacearum TaxID=305 RepID=A0A0K1ZMY3_RALSL|nr:MULTISPECIES: hypothetical protein [Ralstonia]AKZ27329.1 hypothetical protein ACH51_13915 [Ralstonia solanacearum]API74269.1 hypothetical protein AC251_06650 [Ralstonia pseudosolanacearum]KAF3460646.1 hypothetical protein GO278_001539 [Ralstonia solanacearum]MBX9428038.1 hypothetical protein [Ralstonia pseudosolanacearum]MCF1441723.1 hypothetical protein [Ralstonia solanacearum]
MEGRVENVEVLRPDTRAALVLFLLVVCVPALVVVLANVYAKGGAGYRVPAAIVGVLLVTFAVLLVFMQRADFGVADGVLTVRSSFYEVKVPLADVEGEPTIVDLAQHPERGPKIRTNGFSLPGYHSGWYVGADKRRIFAAIAGPRVLSIRVKSGYDILVSVKDPERVGSLRGK